MSSGGTEGMDIRTPMGLMFTIIGAIIAIYGAVQPDKSIALGINVNLIWGAVMTLFGLLMLAMAFMAGKAKSST